MYTRLFCRLSIYRRASLHSDAMGVRLYANGLRCPSGARPKDKSRHIGPSPLTDVLKPTRRAGPPMTLLKKLSYASHQPTDRHVYGLLYCARVASFPPPPPPPPRPPPRLAQHPQRQPNFQHHRHGQRNRSAAGSSSLSFIYFRLFSPSSLFFPLSFFFQAPNTTKERHFFFAPLSGRRKRNLRSLCGRNKLKPISVHGKIYKGRTTSLSLDKLTGMPYNKALILDFTSFSILACPYLLKQ
jgi:hypothetical protein